MDIVHDAQRQCFEAFVDGHRCELDYQRDGERLLITHTGTAPALRGRGLAGELVEHALHWLAPLGLQLLPLCSYVRVHVERHQRWQRLLAPALAQRVLNFWFGPLGSATDGQQRAEWFRKDEAFDAQIREGFGTLIEQALAGGLRDWDREPYGALARLVLLDQFTRNTFRGTARAFAGDALAREAALALIERGGDRALSTVQRVFVYLPLEHAEDMALQQRSVELFEALATEDARLESTADYARRHREVIARYGRFPHRNAALGRTSTADEVAYLAQPGSGF